MRLLSTPEVKADVPVVFFFPAEVAAGKRTCVLCELNGNTTYSHTCVGIEICLTLGHVSACTAGVTGDTVATRSFALSPAAGVLQEAFFRDAPCDSTCRNESHLLPSENQLTPSQRFENVRR